MEKQKRWQLYLILAVIVLTLYNILPTIFYYTKPLRDPIDAQRANTVAYEVKDRVNGLEPEAEEWLYSFSHLIGVKPTAVKVREKDSRYVDVTFKSAEEANVFKRLLPRAGALVPFLPAQLQLGGERFGDSQHIVVVQRQIGTRIDAEDVDQLFRFTPRFDEKGFVAPLYQSVVFDRAARIALGFGGASPQARELQLLGSDQVGSDKDGMLLSVAQEIMDVNKALGAKPELWKRWLASYTQISSKGRDQNAQFLVGELKALGGRLAASEKTLTGDQTKNQALDTATRNQIGLLQQQQRTLAQAAAIVEKKSQEFNAGLAPLTLKEIQTGLKHGFSSYNPQSKLQTFSLEGRNPYVKGLIIDWGANQILLDLYPDVQTMRIATPNGEEESYRKEKTVGLLIQEIARVSQYTDETILPTGEDFGVALGTLTDPQSFLVFDLGSLARRQLNQVSDQLKNEWIPQHEDLKRENFPLLSYDNYLKQPVQQQRLGLVVYAPALYDDAPPEGFQDDSIYVIARGLGDIVRKYRELSNAEGSQQLLNDFNALSTLLQRGGFTGYPGNSWGVSPDFNHDYIFRLPSYYGNLVSATRENFQVKGSKRFATLDFTDVEQRILAWNHIEDRIQEDLIKWRDEYHTAQVDLNAANRYTVPAPTQNVYWSNLKLSVHKYFRGDDRKILKWGLDLSGGKTVRIGLRDKNGRPVTNPDDLHQAVNELYTRINKMGVAERTIRLENDNIILDFPGSQNLSAHELVKASAMYFHVVNEKFGRQNTELSKMVDQFLQEVWNEAVVTNRKDLDSVNEIAWRHFGGNSDEPVLHPRGESARVLFEAGLRLTDPANKQVSSAFNDALSSIAMYRGSGFTEWYGQTHPLMIVFAHYALSGADLENIQVGYDPMKGNVLTFSVKRYHEGPADVAAGNPRDEFYAWTSQFSEDKIAGTDKAKYSNGRGWRMAVILDDLIVSSPNLSGALRDSAEISGRFSQREINQLATDLKAGSLTFTPRILSEQNVSPELGKEERQKGITAAVLALVFVVVAMIGYYHFGGIVASCAVLFNLLVIWGVLQNLGAALTLPGIAGLVLTMGMAVDANVLVFERVREEFSLTGRIASAIQAGYRKAFSAIFDSNITTIIVAAILIQFDAGPIRGFAVTLIIGIITSMFTALFMTRYYFAGWVQNPKHNRLSMSQFFSLTHFDFLKQTKKALILTGFVMVVGIYLFVAQRNTILGMDFTGGYSLTVNLIEKPDHPNYRLSAIKALTAAGAHPRDVQIQQLSRPNQLRIQLGVNMEEADAPFHGLPLAHSEDLVAHEYERNPRITWVVSALQKGGLQIQPADLAHLQDNWTVMSGQFSDVMRNNAIMALTLAFAAILLYITFRFEFKFGMAAVIGLVHDVIVTLGIVAILRWFGVPLQIDLAVIGAIMMIIGYSLNDTIIVFDRIREELRILRKLSYREIINHALNVTLSRTVMTSGTTLLVLLCLVVVGGSSIFAFSLVMTIGILVGTFSSLFIAAPTLLFFHDQEEQRQMAALKLEQARR